MDNQDEFVQVVNPVIKKHFFKYLLYTVQGRDMKGSFQSQRKYKDFKLLKKIITTRWPGCLIPVLPPKSAFNRFSQNEISQGQQLVQDFCSKFIKIKHLWYSEENDIFLRGANFEKSISRMPAQNLEDLIQKYKQSFPDINLTIQSSRIQTCSAFLNSLKFKLEVYDRQITEMLNGQDQENIHMRTFVNFLMPNYEKTLMTQYAQKEEIHQFTFGQVSQTKEKNEYIESLQVNPYSDLLILIRFECRQVKALQNAINSRYKYETQSKQLTIKLSDKQKASMKGSTKNSGQLMTQIEQLQLELDQVQKVLSYVDAILISFELNKFIQTRESEYAKVIKHFSKLQVEQAKKSQEYYKMLLQNCEASQ